MPFEPVHFLLVDDLEENLIALEALLRRDGLVILTARSGTEALELLLHHDIALAIVDVQMPEMSGFELAEFMRGSERTKGVPIIFVTAGSADQQRRFRGYEAGAVDFLQKPIESDIIKSKAGVFFELHRKRQEVARQRDELKIATEKAQRYAEALKEADQRKDEFLATLAHELRNPLAPIRNGLEILRRQPLSGTAENVRDMMDRQLVHMVRLIDDLLDMSRVSKGRIDLRKSVVSLQSIIQSALETSRPHIEEGQHKLIVNMPDDTIWVDADTTRMGQVVGNILNNAAKYTPAGGQIILSLHEERDNAILSIADNGIGIPEQMQSKVFDLFTQVKSSLEQSQGGLGIGLALVKHLVGMHGGAISVTSPGEGKGSTFTVSLPVTVVSAQITESQGAPSADESAVKRNILVVDDNVASAQTTGWMLELIGHDYTLAHDGKEAIEMAERIQPDVIMLDIGLPGMSGYDVCRELRKNPAFKDTLIIAQTGWGQKRDREMAQEAGFNHHLVKPLNLQDLTALLV